MRLFVLCLLCLGIVFPFAAPPSEFDAANQAYQHGNYGEAVELYKDCLKPGPVPAALYYNLGNSYFRLDSLGQAIVYYQAALRRDPGHEDALFNLRFAEARLQDKKPGEGEENPVLQALFSLHHALDLSTQLWILLGLSCLAALLVLLLLLRVARLRSFAIGGLALVVLLAFPGALSAAYKAYILETTRLGVVIVRAADVLSGPGAQYQVLNELHEGTSFEVRSVQEGWVAIRVDSRIGGYVRASQVGLVP